MDAAAGDDLAMIAGTGGTTGRPKGVRADRPHPGDDDRADADGLPLPRGASRVPRLAPLTHAAGVLCFPVLALGGEIVVMATPDLGAFLALVERHRVTHTFLPPTLIYMVLAHERLAATDLSSLQCFWYGAAPMSVTRLEEALDAIGPVMAQLFGQAEAPMMVSMLPPAEHFRADGSRRHASGWRRPGGPRRWSPSRSWTRTAPAAAGESGEIVVRGSLVMAGYYKNPEATAEASRLGWHHTGDVGYLDDDGYLFIVDRAKDMIITGGFNVYSTEVEQALMRTRPSATAPWSGCRTTSGASGWSPSSSRSPAQPSAAEISRSPRTGSAESRHPSRWRSGRTCRGRRSERCSRTRSGSACCPGSHRSASHESVVRGVGSHRPGACVVGPSERSIADRDWSG